MKLSAVWLARVEGIGLVLILLSFFVQIFQNDSEESFRNSQNYHINRKLDHLFILIENNYELERSQLAGRSETGTSSGKERKQKPLIRLKSINHNWELYSRQAKEMERWENQINFFADISTWIFVIGTILAILPKFIPEKME